MGLDAAELVIAYEEELGVRITDEAAAQMRTPRDVIEYFAAHLPARTREEIAEAVRRITIEQLGEVDFGEEKRFIEDMGMS